MYKIALRFALNKGAKVLKKIAKKTDNKVDDVIVKEFKNLAGKIIKCL